MYDLIIIGGGPSGASAGRRAGKLGLNTLLLEKEEFPRYKPCGGGLSAHVDAGTEGCGADLDAILNYRDATRLFLIGNNSVKDFESAKEMFTRGADMVSAARGVLENSGLIQELVENVTSYQQSIGWYNAPKHVCSEGDFRGLAFCCLPVKPCPVHVRA